MTRLLLALAFTVSLAACSSPDTGSAMGTTSGSTATSPSSLNGMSSSPGTRSGRIVDGGGGY